MLGLRLWHAPLDSVKETTSSNGKPVLDAESFQKLLAAAYVLQEHNDRRQAAGSAKQGTALRSQKQAEGAEILDTTHLANPPKSPDSNQTLAQIVATQQQIQLSHLDLPQALNLIAERTRQITGAGGAAIGLLEQQKLVYQATSGSASAFQASKVDINSCVSARSLTQGESFQCANVETDSHLDQALCRRCGIKSLIAVPIFYEGKVAGSLELHFAATNAVREQDVRTCQLMAGLVTESMARAAELEWKQALASERATMLEALDRLKPQLQRLAGDPEVIGRNMGAGEGAAAAVAPAMINPIPCPGCGNVLDAEQLFCGQCGMESPAPKSGNRRNGWGSSGDSGKASSAANPSGLLTESSDANPFSAALEEDWSSVAAALESGADGSEASPQGADFSAASHLGIELPPATTPAGNESEQGEAIALAAKAYPWTSASKAKAWLDTHKKDGFQGTLLNWWNTRRADVYLGVAVILILVALPFIIWSNAASSGGGSSKPIAASANNSTPGSPRRRHATQQPKLTLMEQLLVSMGLAEPPPAPAYNGNPNTQVWVDLHTALYYCPGTDLYGKTPKGKFTSQRDAQMDQFEPAYRQACD